MSENESHRATEEFFYQQFPLASAMGMKVEFSDAEKLVLTAPNSLNHNHLGTAFGGSISALAIMAGYGFLWLYLEDREVHIVIRSSSIEYHRPIHGMLQAICRTPDAATLATFRACFENKSRARISLQVTLEEENQICASFEGVFVALR